METAMTEVTQADRAMDELVERVAQKLFNGSDDEWNSLTLLHQIVFLSQARAIIPIVAEWQRERDAGIAEGFETGGYSIYEADIDPTAEAIATAIRKGGE